MTSDSQPPDLTPYGKVNVQSISAGKARRIDRRVRLYILATCIIAILGFVVPHLGWWLVPPAAIIAWLGARRMNEVERLESLASMKPSKPIKTLRRY